MNGKQNKTNRARICRILFVLRGTVTDLQDVEKEYVPFLDVNVLISAHTE